MYPSLLFLQVKLRVKYMTYILQHEMSSLTFAFFFKNFLCNIIIVHALCRLRGPAAKIVLCGLKVTT